MRNLQKLIIKVRRKYKYDLEPPIHGMIWGEKPLSTKADNIVLKAIYKEMINPQISSKKYAYLANQFVKYLYNNGSMIKLNRPSSREGDFDGEVLQILKNDIKIDTELYNRINTSDQCKHRFISGKSSLIDIGNGMCRCELCNLEFNKDIVDDSYDIEDPNRISMEINKINLEELFTEEEE